MDGMRVSDVMTSEPIFCYEDQYLQEARRVMEQSGLHRLPVLGRDRRLVGMLTLPAVLHLT
jgi:CBS domain-containing protein